MDPDLPTDPTAVAAQIEAAGSTIVAAYRAGPDAPVRSCPGWTNRDLTLHTAQVHQWAAGLIRGGPAGGFPDVPSDVEPADWAGSARRTLCESIAASDPAQQAWTFVGPRPVAWWWRRQVNETAVHAWDATAHSPAPWTMAPAIAADALAEFLTEFLPRRWGHKAPTWGEGRTVHLHRTDGEGEWLVTIAESPTITEGHAKGDLAVRGPILDLLLWTIGRTGPDSVELFGDAALGDAWQANVRL